MQWFRKVSGNNVPYTGERILVYMLPARLSAHNYLNLLRNVLPELLNDIPLDIRRNTMEPLPALVYMCVSVYIRYFRNNGFQQRFRFPNALLIHQTLIYLIFYWDI